MEGKEEVLHSLPSFLRHTLLIAPHTCCCWQSACITTPHPPTH